MTILQVLTAWKEAVQAAGYDRAYIEKNVKGVPVYTVRRAWSGTANVTTDQLSALAAAAGLTFVFELTGHEGYSIGDGIYRERVTRRLSQAEVAGAAKSPACAFVRFERGDSMRIGKYLSVCCALEAEPIVRFE